MSIRPGNIVPLMEVGLHNFDLTEYLVEQVVQSPKDRFGTLTTFYPHAEQTDWKLEVAGMRVQIIKRDPVKGGILKFGTEIVCGGRPFAGRAAWCVARCLDRGGDHDQGARALLRQAVDRTAGREMQQIIPSYGHSLIDDAELTRQVRADTASVLGLQNV